MFGIFKKKKSEATGLDISIDQIVPRFKNESFLTTLIGMNIPDDQLPLTQPFVAGLKVTYAFDMPSGFMMASHAQIAELGLKTEDVLKVAKQNLLNNLPEIRFNQQGSLHVLITGGNMEALLLLVEKIWEDFSSKMTGKLIACAPHRDALLFCDSDDSDAMALLEQFSNEAYNQGDNHGLTLDKLEWTQNGWIPFGDPSE